MTCENRFLCGITDTYFGITQRRHAIKDTITAFGRHSEWSRNSEMKPYRSSYSVLHFVGLLQHKWLAANIQKLLKKKKHSLPSNGTTFRSPVNNMQQRTHLINVMFLSIAQRNRSHTLVNNSAISQAGEMNIPRCPTLCILKKGDHKT